MFSVKPINFACYKFPNFADLNSSLGLDVQRNDARFENNAYCDAINKVIYGTTDECYFHELVHLYVGQNYFESCHNLINEGLATYLGGSGLSLNQHLHYLAIDLKKHTEYDLNNFLNYKKKQIDATTKKVWTNYKITIGGLLCKIVYEKYGFIGIKKLMSSGYSDEPLYKTVCELLHIKQNDLNLYLRKEIYKY